MEDFNNILKGIREALNKWKIYDILWRKFNITKVVILLKLTYNFNAIKIPTALL